MAAVPIGGRQGFEAGLKRMRRTFSAFEEWLQLRARPREERRFHLDRAAAEFRSLGLSPRAANRKARVRFGSSRNMRIARREIGADLPGLARLFRANRVAASVWLQPAVLLAAVVLILVLSPAPRAVLEGVIGKPLAAKDRRAVVLTARTLNPSYEGISSSDFEALRSTSTLTGVERYQTLDVRAQAAQGATLAAIQSEARARTGNRRIWAGWLFQETGILMGPAKAAWLAIAFYAIFSLRSYTPQLGKGRWLLYGFGVLSLHALATMMAWALAVQIWYRAFWSEAGALGIFVMVVVFFRITAIQYRFWRADLLQRCPICLDRLLLPLTEGTPDGVLLNPATTESVCAHGHCVLVENRWSRAFRREASPLQVFVHL
jgi:hypothetical protein